MIGNKLRKFRNEKGWSQDAVAAQLGISQPAYSQYESNKTMPDAVHLMELSKVYNKPMEEFYESSQVEMHSNTIENAYVCINNLVVHNKDAYESHIESLTKEIAKKDALIDRLLNKH